MKLTFARDSGTAAEHKEAKSVPRKAQKKERGKKKRYRYRVWREVGREEQAMIIQTMSKDGRAKKTWDSTLKTVRSWATRLLFAAEVGAIMYIDGGKEKYISTRFGTKGGKG